LHCAERLEKVETLPKDVTHKHKKSQEIPQKKDQKFIYLVRVCKCRLLGFKVFQIFVKGHIIFLVSKLDKNPNIRQLKYSCNSKMCAILKSIIAAFNLPRVLRY
jgi:hypothetical protein